MKESPLKQSVQKTLAFLSLSSLFTCGFSGQLAAQSKTLLVDFVGGDQNNAINSTSAHFAVANSAVNPAASVNAIAGGNSNGNAVTGIGISASLDITGTGFSQGSGDRNDVAILDGYIFANASNDLDEPIVNVTGLTGIAAGDPVTLTVYAIGDRDAQVGPVVLDLGNGNTVTSAVSSPANPFVTFQFNAPSGFNSFEFLVDNDPADEHGNNFAAINGFSLTSGSSEAGATPVFNSPMSNDVIVAPADVYVNVGAPSNGGNTVSNVRLFQDGVFNRQENIDPYEWNLSDLAAGSYLLRADVTYSNGDVISIEHTLNVTSPNPDVDNDGLLDAWELVFGFSIDPATGALGEDGANGDPDGDLLTNLEEFNNETNPLTCDTDNDGLTDGSEVNTHNTDPTLADSDGDGSSDGEEVFFVTAPNDSQSLPDANQTVSGIQSVGSIGPYLDGSLPQITPGGDQNAEENWAVEEVFSNLSFGQLKGLVSEPRSTNLHVIQRNGAIQRVDVSNPNTATQVLNISSMIVNGDNGGLRSVVFHPDFNVPGANQNHIYCFYSTTAQTSRGFTSNDGSFFYRLSRFTRDESTGTFPTNSELVLIQQHSRDTGQHFGGSLGFDRDGFLLIGWGDMEFRNDRVGVDFYQDVQRIDRIFQGAALRIDVDNQGGMISHAPVRTLQGSSGPHSVPGTSQSCLPDHNYYHVDNLSGRDYMIPSDNYFVLNPPAAGDGTSFPNTPAHGPALQEHQAMGTRNPWRMAVDPVDGDVAFFNVGSNSGNDQFEEVELLSPGANWEWPYLEGETSQTFETGLSEPPSLYAPVALGNKTRPLAYWPRSVGRVSSGGLFYRGNLWPSLDGQLVFTDQVNGQIWAIDYKSAGAPSSNFSQTDGVFAPNNFVVRELIDTNLRIRQMAVGPMGQEIYCAHNSQVYRLFNSTTVNPEPPALLSQTGAFTDLVNLSPRAGLIPFEPASQLWSDRAAKLRWIAVPNDEGLDGEYDQTGEQITYSEDGEWAYPIGTVFIKQFSLPADLRNQNDLTNVTPVETRFSVRGSDGNWFFFTYRWRADGSDADLLSGEESDPIPIINLEGFADNQVWHYPSRQQCFECHQSGAGSVLGMKSRQLNYAFTYPSTGATANQVTTFSELGLFDKGPDFGTLSTALKSVSIDDSTESLELRVRSYLDSNCSYCHRPGSEAGRAEFDALLTTPLNLAGIINADTFAGTMGVAGAQIVTPRAPEKSILYLRDSSLDPNLRMPPVGRTLNDSGYLSILKAWIGTLGLTEFIAWAEERGIDSGLTGDFDEDGFSNVIEFVFRQGDADVDFSTLPELIVTGVSNPTIEIPVSGDALTDGFEIRVEDSNNLEDWYPVGDALSELEVVSDSSSPGTDGILKVRLSATSEQRFLRYGVVIP